MSTIGKYIMMYPRLNQTADGVAMLAVNPPSHVNCHLIGRQTPCNAQFFTILLPLVDLVLEEPPSQFPVIDNVFFFTQAGSQFPNSNITKCRFGTVDSPTNTVVNDSFISCVSPAGTKILNPC